MARKVLIGVILAVMVVNLIIIAIVFSGGSTGPNRPMPNPNGYDDFVKAGQALTGDVHNYEDMNRQELAALVATNAGAKKLVRLGLTHECRVPDDYDKDYIGRLVKQLTLLKGLSLLLAAEGKLDELDGHTNDAAKVYLEDARYGQECGRGGVLISRLVGDACEGVALDRLKYLIKSVDAPSARELAGGLQLIDEKAEPMEATRRQERLWNRDANGIRGEIMSLFESKALRDFGKAEEKTGLAQHDSIARLRRQMIIAFAARAYELEKGKPPQSVQDLVPDYLKAVPKDPVTGRDLGLGQ